MNKEILQRLQSKKKLLDTARPIPQAALKRLKSELSIEWTYNSNAIEGNTLSLKETKLVLEEGVTIKGKNLREHFEVKNHEKAIAFIEGLSKPRYKLLEKDLLKLHSLVLDNIESEFVGRYRNGQVRILGANFLPPSYIKVEKLIKDLINNVNSNPEKLNFLDLTVRFHHKFVWIHPFFDGNGRTARLLMNLVLMKHGYPPAIILMNDRKKYYRALQAADQQNYAPLTLLTAQALERSLDLYISTCSPSAAQEYLPLSKLAKKFSYSQEYLSLLARRGLIDAYKDKRNWLSTEDAIKSYTRKLKK